MIEFEKNTFATHILNEILDKFNHKELISLKKEITLNDSNYDSNLKVIYSKIESLLSDK